MKTILDILLDPEDSEPIALVNESGKSVRFEQVAVVPHKDKIYCILKPLDGMEGVADDEAVVFWVDDTDDYDPLLRVETDEKTCLDIFDVYYDLIEQEQNKQKK